MWAGPVICCCNWGGSGSGRTRMGENGEACMSRKGQR